MKPVLQFGKAPCGFCGDTGSHALFHWYSHLVPCVICSDCVEIFYKIAQQREDDFIRIYSKTRQ